MTAAAVARESRWKRAYELRTSKGTIRVLCEKHLDEFRAEEDYAGRAVKFTGRNFDAKLCDECYPEKT